MAKGNARKTSLGKFQFGLSAIRTIKEQSGQGPGEVFAQAAGFDPDALVLFVWAGLLKDQPDLAKETVATALEDTMVLGEMLKVITDTATMFTTGKLPPVEPEVTPDPPAS